MLSKLNSLYPEHPTIGEMSDFAAAKLLNELEDLHAPDPSALDIWARAMPIYRSTSHVFGFIAAGSRGTVHPVDAGSINVNNALIGRQVNISLDRLWVYDYPGKGEHNVLVQFSAEHQPTGGVPLETVTFSQKFRVIEKQGAGIIGYPVFRGLTVGQDGIQFKIFTINVSNTSDQQALDFLNSSPISAGIKLLTTANPTIAPFTEMARGITNMILTRHQNIPVQDIFMGLDFSNVPTHARLDIGSYVVVQVQDPAAWDWTQVSFETANGQLVNATSRQSLPHNYFSFSVSH